MKTRRQNIYSLLKYINVLYNNFGFINSAYLSPATKQKVHLQTIFFRAPSVSPYHVYARDHPPKWLLISRHAQLSRRDFSILSPVFCFLYAAFFTRVTYWQIYDFISRASISTALK